MSSFSEKDTRYVRINSVELYKRWISQIFVLTDSGNKQHASYCLEKSRINLDCTLVDVNQTKDSEIILIMTRFQGNRTEKLRISLRESKTLFILISEPDKAKRKAFFKLKILKFHCT